MADTSEGSGAENESAEDAPKTDYEIAGETDNSELDAEKVVKAAKDAEKEEAENDDDEEDNDDVDDDEGDEESDTEDDDAEDDEEQDDEEQADEDESDKGKRKRRGGFQKKIDRLNNQVEDLKAQLANQSTDRIVDPFAAKPNRQDFRTDRDFEDAHSDWRSDQREVVRQTEAKKELFKKSQQVKANRYEAKTQELRKDENYAKTIDSYDGPLTMGMEQALIDSEFGPQVALEIAKNPELGERMARMTLLEINKVIARMEIGFEGKKVNKKSRKSTSQKKVKSSAPPPVKPVKASSKIKVNPDSEDYEDYLKNRQRRRGN